MFATRAARLRHLAAESPVGDYLRLMADLVDAQHRALQDCQPPGADEDRISLAQAHGMPPLQAVGWPRDPLWRAILARLVDEVAQAPGTPAEAAEVCAALRRAVDEDPRRWRTWPKPCWPSRTTASTAPPRPSSWRPCRSTGPAWPAVSMRSSCR